MSKLKQDDVNRLKAGGMFPQKQKDLFVMRLHAVGGDLTTEQLRKIAAVAKKHGKGKVHLTTRQGIEIHNVRFSDLDKARKELANVGVKMGACGPRVRVIIACPGNSTCRWGLIDTKKIAKYLNKKYFRRDTPHKFKMAVSGCPNNCAKPTENDVGVMGGILPRFESRDCTQCNLCVNVCPTQAIAQDGDQYRLEQAKCILCNICIANCPTSSWVGDKRGYTLFLGGTMGKRPRLGTRIKDLIKTEAELFDLVEKAFQYYRSNGKKKERFGHMIDRIGEKQFKEDILYGE